MKRIILLFAFIVFLCGYGVQAAATDGDVVISEVMPNPGCGSYAGGDPNVCEATEANYEWVEIYNKGDSTVDLTGWSICDVTGCDPLSGAIAAGAYLLIAQTEAELADELSQYSAIVNTSLTIELNSAIGNGLSNSDETIYLKSDEITCGTNLNNSCVTDCISYHSTSLIQCDGIITDPAGGGGLAFRSGSDGYLDTSLDNSLQDGQSIVNIQGIWYQSGPGTGAQNQASPYGDNIAEGGSPSAISLNAFSSNSVSKTPFALGLMIIALTATGVLLRHKIRAD